MKGPLTVVATPFAPAALPAYGRSGPSTVAASPKARDAVAATRPKTRAIDHECGAAQADLGPARTIGLRADVVRGDLADHTASARTHLEPRSQT